MRSTNSGNPTIIAMFASHRVGRASVAPTIMVHRRSVRAPQAMRMPAPISRIQSGTGNSGYGHCCLRCRQGSRSTRPSARGRGRRRRRPPARLRRPRPQRAPFPPNGEPDEADPRRDLREQDERPRSRVPKAEIDRRGEQEVDVAHLELDHGHGQEQGDRQPVARDRHERAGSDQDPRDAKPLRTEAGRRGQINWRNAGE